jgi:hypothetical protein
VGGEEEEGHGGGGTEDEADSAEQQCGVGELAGETPTEAVEDLGEAQSDDEGELEASERRQGVCDRESADSAQPVRATPDLALVPDGGVRVTRFSGARSRGDGVHREGL